MNDARHNRLFHDITEPSWLHRASHGLSSDLSASEREMVVSELRRRLAEGDYCLHPAVATTQDGQERCQWRREDRLVLDAVAMRLAGEMKLAADISTALTNARGKVRTLRNYLGKHPDAWVVQGSLAGFHREIDHDRLYQRLSRALPGEPLLLRLLWQYLHSAVERDGMLSDNGRGLLPGNALFPLLCDHFLEPLDRGIDEYGVLFTRVLDGWVLAAPTRWQLDKVRGTINATLQDLGLDTCIQATPPVRASAGVELHGYRITPNALSTARTARKRQLFALRDHYSCAGAGTTIPTTSAQWDRHRELPGGIHRRLAACPPQIPAAVSSPSSPRSTLPASLWAIPLLSGGIGAAHAAVTTRALNVAVTANAPLVQMDFDGNGDRDWGCYGVNLAIYATRPNAMSCYGWNGPGGTWPTPKWDPTPTTDPNALFGPGTGANFVNNGDDNITSGASISLPDNGNSYWFRIITSNPSATPRYGWLEIKRSGTTYTIVDFVYDANGHNAALTPAGGGDNAAPSIAIAGTTLSYTENAAATQIDSAATLSDPDGDADWDGGTLEVQITANNEAADEISIPDNIVGTINTSGTSLRDGATTIGTLSASEGTVTNGTKLTITFNASATNARVQQVLRAISYRNTSDNPGTANRTVTFTATDKNTAAASDTRTISVTAVNDNPTITSNGGGATAAVNVAENTTAVTTVTATDPEGNTLTYSISGGVDAAKFSINSTTGALTFIAAPDFENPTDVGTDNVYDVQVTVTDNGTGNLTDVQAIAVTVTNVNEAPTITSDGGGATAAVNAAENQTAVTTVTATDPDAGSVLTYSISGGADAAKFSINGSTGALTFVTAPDFENPTDVGANNVYDVQVTVTDNGTGNLTDMQAIAVTVTNVNEAPTITSDGGGASAAVNVAENTTAVTTVTATDPDAGSVLTYSISGGADAAKFSINGSTGALTFVTAPDFENPTDVGANNVYDVQVTVTDNGTGNLTDVQAIAVTVTDANDPPTITSNGGGATASVNAAENQTAVTTVTATDLESNNLTYSISGGADAAKFSINSSTGVLTFVAAPDFENPTDVGANNVYDVQVTVTDDGAGNPTDTQDIAVTITDINEAPTITSDGGGATAAVNAAENQTAVTTVTATDPDAGSVLTYSISGGADAAKFSINGSTGALTFVTAPDFENPTDVGANNVYDVQVTVTDNGTGNLTDVQAIAVTVTDANDPPTITSNGGGATASVNAAENQTAVTTVTATDLEGNNLTYSISGGADAAKFSINSSTGVLTFVAAPDFENPTDVGANNVYDVQVTVTDDGAGNPTDTQDIAVTVTNVNEAPMLANLSGDSVSYSIGAAPVALDNGGNATVSDIDSTDFSGGNVTASIVTNGQAGEDVLSVGTLGNISTSGSNVIHSDSGGLTIGTIAGGSGGAPLVITLNANATVARVRDLISALQYHDTNAATVNTLARTVRITVDDGDGGASTSANQDVTVNLVRAPLIDLDGDNSSGAVGTGYNGSFTEDGGAVAAADSDNTVSDDGTFKLLTVTLTNRPDGASESLSSSYGTGAQTVNGENVTIGAYDSGTGVLMITVDDGSTDAVTMQMLIASIRYDNSSDTPDLTNRAITFAATDNDDNLGASSTAVITITAVNDAPVFSALDGTPAYTEDGAAVVLDGNVTVADAELDAADNYNGATLMLARNGSANAADVFSNTGTLSALTEGNPFNLGGSDLGTVTTNSGGTLLLTFNANATAADVDSVLQSIAYSNGSDAPDASVQIDWSLSDGNSGAQGSGGAKSASGSTTVSVTAVNDAPVVSGGPASLGSTLQNVTSTGVLVSNIIGGVSYSDPDGMVTSGIAVTAVTGSGTWEYSTDNTTWTAFPAVSDVAALLLDSASYVRFVPAAGWTGSATLTFQGWDQTSGTASSNGSAQTDDATTNGGTTAYSTGTANASLSVIVVPPPPPPPPVPVNGTDSDRDGIPDSWELAHGLDPNDPNDAGEDTDGDGVSNLDEYRNGTDPQQDDYPPEVTPPADITVNASGLFTAVDPGMADAYDAHDGTVAVERSVPVSTWSTSLARASGALAHFAPGQHTITWSATDQAGNVGTATQTVNIIPQVNLAKDQVSAEGAQVHVGFYLNGPAVDYPVRVPFSVGGTAAVDGSDHTLVNGVVTITSGTEGMLSFDTVDDGPGEGSETITVTLGMPENAVAGPLASHTIVLAEGNVAPNVTLRAAQAQVATLTALQGGGAVVVSSEVVDPNAFDTHHYDWSGSDNSLADIDGAGESFTFDPAALAPGFYTVRLHVDDGQDSAETELTVQVVTELPPLGSDDSDGDGIDDQTEGYGDNDQDGVPNYLDAIDAPNVLQQLRGENSRYLLETESGLRLLLGQSAREAGSGQTSVDKDVVARTRSGSDDKRDYSYPSDPQDFVVDALPVAGQTVRVVLPQTAALPGSPEYRVLTQAGWQTFVAGMGNAVSSAAGEAGYCPPPGDEAYQSGLTEGHLCVQLSLQDGGPNDNDGTANGRLATTGVVAVRQSSGGGGGGTLNAVWMALVALLALGVHRTQRRRDDEAGA